MEVAGRPKPLLKDLNEHIMCGLCRGYLIDATTLVECLHSFCRGCIVRLYSGARACPICGVRTTPPLLPDTRLQRLVYLVVPGLFRSELQRRRQFRVVNPLCPPLPPPLGAINLTLDDFVSLSLEQLDETIWEVGQNRVRKRRNVVSSACRPWNEDTVNETSQGDDKMRYLKCPAAVTVRHLVRLLMLKRGWEETNLSVVHGITKIEIMYHRIGTRSREKIHRLNPFWTLLDLACIFRWKRMAPMKLVYRLVRKEEMLSISEIPSNYVQPKEAQPAIENIPRPPTPPPSPKPSREPEVEARPTPESNTKLPRALESSVDPDKETKSKKPRCEVTPVMRTPDPPASLSTRNHHHSEGSTRSKDMGRLEHRKRRKRRNKRVIAEITTTPREDLLKLKVRLTPCPPRITSSGGSSGGGGGSGDSGRSKERLLQLRAVRREKLKAISKQRSAAMRSSPSVSPPLIHSPDCEETSAKDGYAVETEETIEDIIDSIPDEVVRIAQSEDNTVVERVAIKNEVEAKEREEREKEEAREKELREKEAREKELREKEAREKEAREKELREKEEAREKEAREKEVREKEAKKSKSKSESPERTKRITESPKKDEEILRRLGLVAVNEAIVGLRDKMKQRSQHSIDKANSLDRERLEKQLRESKANRVRSLLAEKQLRDALKSIMSKTNEERSSVSSTSVPASAAAATASATVPAAAPAVTVAAIPEVTSAAIPPATTPANPSPAPATAPKKKGPPPLAPLRVAKPSGFATTSGMLVSNASKYETPLDLSSGGQGSGSTQGAGVKPKDPLGSCGVRLGQLPDWERADGAARVSSHEHRRCQQGRSAHSSAASTYVQLPREGHQAEPRHPANPESPGSGSLPVS
ncbi:protein suppressor 2 of zeste isoform X2 [Harpegnathos saltator]|uniref:protein suppressor 2 of zeste isoform X2 n=1 Tax=Harpegnathos saltator TaxID=610380 RepID=UPI000DBEE42F|nr:protein suppressor 2 of zeste isoform X2 [Harpegnathos saltator]